MEESKTSGAGGVSLLGLLTIVFIVLKLIGVISWSWWWVLAPLWIPFTGAIVTIVILIPLIKHVFK